MFDRAQLGFAILDADLRIVEANAALGTLVRRPAAALEGMPIEALLVTSPGDDGDTDDLTGATHASSLLVERRLARPDGTLVWADVTIVRVAADGRDRRPWAFATVKDVSTRRLAESALRVSEEQLRIVFESAPVGIRINSFEGHTIRANRAFEEMVGYTEEQLQTLMWWEYTHPDDRAANIALWSEMREGKVDRFSMEKRYVRSDGAVVWSTLETSLIRDAGGDPWFTVAIDADVTARRRLEEQLAQAQKMEAIGRLAGGVAHDFNNLLTAILGSAHLLLRGLPADEPERVEAEQIAEAAERAAALTGQLLAFGRRQTLKPVEIDLNQVVLSSAKMLDRLLGAGIDVVLDLAADPGIVRADPAQMDQVVMNLALNARDAMPDGGTLALSTANVTVAATPGTAGAPGASGGDLVVLSVRDEGVGMDAATSARVFEPFFSTKDDAGTGLGLATVHGIVQQSGGSIEVVSEPGKGSEFRVLLPRVDVPAAAPCPSQLAAPSCQAQGTILLVEDEAPVRRIAARILLDAGYKVIEAGNADEATLASESFAGPIDILVSDVRMPGRSGPRLARALLSSRPGMRILFISGYAAGDIEAELGAAAAQAGFLEKPFTPASLEAAVAGALAAPQPVAAG